MSTTMGHISVSSEYRVSTDTTDYKCRNCGQRYRRLSLSYSCCVLHGPKECCHAFEQRITKKGYPK